MITLRTYVKSDAETITRFVTDERTCYQWSADRYGHFPVTPQDMNMQYAGFETNEDLFPYTAVDEEQRIVGHLIMRYPKPEDRSVIRFGFVIVDSFLRGKGYGAQMLREALRIAFTKKDAKRVTLGVFQNNTPAALCYLSVGFHPPLDPETRREYTVDICGETWICCNLEMMREEFLHE